VATTYTTETFFRPPEIARERLSIPAELFNRCRLLLSRCQYDYIFVPIRSMQFIAVIDKNEIIFVDSLNYAVRGDEGGRMILLAWDYSRDGSRDSLNAPVAIELVKYVAHARDLHMRLMAEFPKALDILEARAREQGCEPKLKKVIPFPK
jgi:hypothetical protein